MISLKNIELKRKYSLKEIIIVWIDQDKVY